MSILCLHRITCMATRTCVCIVGRAMGASLCKIFTYSVVTYVCVFIWLRQFLFVRSYLCIILLLCLSHNIRLSVVICTFLRQPVKCSFMSPSFAFCIYAVSVPVYDVFRSVCAVCLPLCHIFVPVGVPPCMCCLRPCMYCTVCRPVCTVHLPICAVCLPPLYLLYVCLYVMHRDVTVHTLDVT